MTRPAAILALAALGVLACSRPALAQQCADGTPPPCRAAAARAPAPTPNSIAVLPLASRSPDTADAYLAEALPEQIGGRLSQVDRLHVTSATAVAAQWRRTPDALVAARALRVEWLVTGTLRRVGRQLSANVELVRTASGEQAWAMAFRRGDDDLAAIEEQVAESVAVAIVGRLAPAQLSRVRRTPTRNVEAYRLYLYGRTLAAHRTSGGGGLLHREKAWPSFRIPPKYLDYRKRDEGQGDGQSDLTILGLGFAYSGLRGYRRVCDIRAEE